MGPFVSTTTTSSTNERQSAYQATREALLINPKDTAAWVRLSTLIDDVPRQYECLRRALALDPQHAEARSRLETLRLQHFLTHTLPSTSLPKQQDAKLGAYLVAFGQLTAEQLADALAEQRSKRKRGELIALGEVLLDNRWVTPRSLARALIIQLQQRTPSNRRLLGERLLAANIITISQLESVLEEQARLRQEGRHIALGTLLLRKGYVTYETLVRDIVRFQQSDTDHTDL